MSDVIQIYPGSRLCPALGYCDADGWIYARHPDGQWVTVGKPAINPERANRDEALGEMSEPNRISVGDTVSVSFHGGQCTISHRAKVLYMPCATGDSWRFEDLDTGDIHYVSEGCTVTKKEPREFKP